MTMRSPSKCGGSYPNLSTTCEQDIEAGFVNFRKRKQPEDEDCFTEAIERLTRNLNGSISSLRDEMNSKLESFTSDINAIVTTEMNNFRTLIDEMKNEVTDIKVACKALQSSVDELHSKQQSSSAQITTICDQIDSHHERLHNLEQSQTPMVNVTGKMQEMSDIIKALQLQLASKDQRDRLKNLEITNVPVTKGENLLSILKTLSVKVGLDLAPQDIDDIHRVRKFTTDSKNTVLPPNIIVHFSLRKRKEEFLAACKIRREITTVDLGYNGPSKPIFINEHLTPQNKMLFKRVRAAASEHGFKFVWVKDCKLFVRKSESSKIIFIASEDDLKKIK